MITRRIIYLVLLLLVGSCSVGPKKEPHVRKPLFPKRHQVVVEKPGVAPEVKESPKPEPHDPKCTCKECKCEEPKQKPVAQGKWVVVQVPVYGGWRGRQFQGYQARYQWQPAPQAQAAPACSGNSCSSCR
jgi:hypothetical protein